MADLFRVDVAHLNTYLTTESPRVEYLTPRALLHVAYQAFLAAGVLKAGDQPLPAARSVTVDRTGVTLHLDKRSFYWTDDRIPPVEGLIAGLAYHMASVLNQDPTPGPWPKQVDAGE